LRPGTRGFEIDWIDIDPEDRTRVLADVAAFPFLKYASLGPQAGDTDPFHLVLAEQTPLGPDSPLHAWVARIDALPRG
jgi:hypothetical protein